MRRVGEDLAGGDGRSGVVQAPVARRALARLTHRLPEYLSEEREGLFSFSGAGKGPHPQCMMREDGEALVARALRAASIHRSRDVCVCERLVYTACIPSSFARAVMTQLCWR